MNEKQLYERQYGERKLISDNSFLFLRKAFKKFDLDRRGLALKGTSISLFVISKISGSRLFAKFRNFYPSVLTGDICVKAQEWA